MRNKRLIAFALVLVVLLSGCVTQEMREEQIRAELEAKEPSITGEQSFLGTPYVIDNEVYYPSGGKLYRLSDTLTPVSENYAGMTYSEAHKLFYKLSAGILTSFNPVTGDETSVCNVESKDASIKCITENYMIFGTSRINFLLNLNDLSVTGSKYVFRSTDEILTADGDIVYFSDTDYNICSYDIEAGTEAVIFKAPFGSIKAVVHGDNFYSLEALGYIYSVSGLRGGEPSEPELVDGAFAKGDVLALASYDEGIYFICSTRQYTLDLWQLPDGGEAEKLASWDEVYYYFSGSGRLSVSDSLIACCVTTDEKCRIFTYDLETQKSEVYYVG